MARTRKRVWIAGFLVFVALMFGISTLVLSSWSELKSVAPAEAQRSFSDLRAGAAAGPAYLEIADGGEVLVHRELEGDEPSELRALSLLAWDPGRAKLLRIDFPFWWVRLKSSDTMNLGTLTSFALRNWEHLDLRVTEEDLALRGPGLVLDRTRPDGGRLLLWLE